MGCARGALWLCSNFTTARPARCQQKFVFQFFIDNGFAQDRRVNVYSRLGPFFLLSAFIYWPPLFSLLTPFSASLLRPAFFRPLELGRPFSSYFTTKEQTDENVLADLKGSQYDKCVFLNDNDVVDHQVTIMQFANGKTACHTMTAFSRLIYRDLKVHGTKAELVGVIEDNSIEIRYFGGAVEKITVDISMANVGGHAGGDFFMMNSIYKDLNGEKADGVTYLDVSIESHLMSFGAEESRIGAGQPVLIEK